MHAQEVAQEARTSYRKKVLVLLSCNRKEVLAVSRTQAQETRNSSSCGHKKTFLRVHYFLMNRFYNIWINIYIA